MQPPNQKVKTLKHWVEHKNLIYNTPSRSYVNDILFSFYFNICIALLAFFSSYILGGPRNEHDLLKRKKQEKPTLRKPVQ